MSALASEITGFVAGDDLEISRTVTGLPADIEMAWFTVKHRADDTDEDAIVQKEITVTDAPDTGQIEEAGDLGTDGTIRFDLVPVDTAAIGSQSCVFDIQIKLSTGKIYTIEKGTIVLTGDVTKATS